MSPIADDCFVQRHAYNGKFKKCGLKWQVVLLPNGICVVAGPHLGPRHDSRVLLESSIEDDLSSLTHNLNLQDPLAVYGDSAYKRSLHCARAVKSAIASTQMKRLSDYMKKIRVLVENILACIERTSPGLNARNLQLGNSPIGTLLCMCVLVVSILQSSFTDTTHLSHHQACSFPSLSCCKTYTTFSMVTL